MEGATLHEPSGRLGRGPFVAPLVVIPATLAIALAYGYARPPAPPPAPPAEEPPAA